MFLTHLRVAVLAAGLIVSIAAVSSPAAGRTDDGIALTGCLIRGEGGYLLTNGPSAPAWQKADASVTPGAVGTTGTVASIFYWLRDDDELRAHVGHRVEVRGDLESEISDGEIKVDRKDQWTELEIKAGGDRLKARIPNVSIVPVGDGDQKADVLVRRVDVEKVQMLSATCQ
jgi:hypothetical protein